MAYIEVESDLSFNLARLLILINASAAGSKLELILTLDRIVIYEFLARNPILLLKLLRQLEKKHKIQAREYEVGGLSSKYYNKSDIYSFDSIKTLIQLLFAQNLVTINKISNEQFTVYATESGKLFCSELKTDYYERFSEIAGVLRILNSVSIPKLRSQINILINA